MIRQVKYDTHPVTQTMAFVGCPVGESGRTAMLEFAKELAATRPPKYPKYITG